MHHLKLIAFKGLMVAMLCEPFLFGRSTLLAEKLLLAFFRFFLTMAHYLHGFTLPIRMCHPKRKAVVREVSSLTCTMSQCTLLMLINCVSSSLALTAAVPPYFKHTQNSAPYVVLVTIPRVKTFDQ